MKVATPKTIKQAKQWFKDNPDRKLQVSWAEYWTQARFEQWLIGCVHARCNRGLDMTGRKFSSEYHFTMLRFSREINSNHVIRYIPALDGLRDRFAHRQYLGD